MSKNREIKKEKVEDLKKQIVGKSLVFVDYEGITVEEISELRGKLREDGSTLKVVKNTLLKRTMEESKISVADNFFKGMMAAVISDNDKFINSSKSVRGVEKLEKIKIKGGFFEGEVIDEAKVRKFASLFSKEEFHGILVGCLSGIVANLVYVLDDIHKQKQEGGVADSEEKS